MGKLRAQALLRHLDDKYPRAPHPAREGRHGTWWMGEGFVGLRVVRDHLYLTDLWVAPNRRGRRAGRALLRAVLREIDRIGVEVRTHVHPFNKGETGLGHTALTLWYTRYGFEPYKGKTLRREAVEG